MILSNTGKKRLNGKIPELFFKTQRVYQIFPVSATRRKEKERDRDTGKRQRSPGKMVENDTYSERKHARTRLCQLLTT